MTRPALNGYAGNIVWHVCTEPYRFDAMFCVILDAALAISLMFAPLAINLRLRAAAPVSQALLRPHVCVCVFFVVHREAEAS